MVKVTGRDEVRRYFQQAPEALSKILKGAARTGGQVIADEAEARCTSKKVGAAIVNRARNRDGVFARLITIPEGWERSVGIWLEYGTDPHFISVADSQREGRGIGRINQQVREAEGDGSLVINGNFVGGTVFHPGARPFPFMRPALDTKEREAVAAAQGYINAQITRHGLNVPDVSESDE